MSTPTPDAHPTLEPRDFSRPPAPTAPNLPPPVELELSKVSAIEQALAHERYNRAEVLDKVLEGVACDLQARESQTGGPAPTDGPARN